MTKQRRNKNQANKKPVQQLSQNQVQFHAQYQGPLPPPKYLSEYESIQPGLAERIVTMAEKEQAHRQELEGKDLDAAIQSNSKEFTEARIGQVFALIIGIAVIVAGAYCATNGAPWPGAVIGSSGVIGLVSVFIMGRNAKGENGHTKSK